MPESAPELPDRIRLGEDTTLELKEIVFAGKRNALADEMAAFANTTRNETIVNRLRAIPTPRDLPWIQTTRSTFMDKRGEGVPIILDRSEAHSSRAPEYRMIGESELLLTIFAAGLDESGYTSGTPA